MPTIVTGFIKKGPSIREYEVYIVFKLYRIVSRRLRQRSTIPFKRVHFDIVFIIEVYNNTTYFIHFLYNYIRMNYVTILQDKKQNTLIKAIRNFIIQVNNRYGYNVKIFYKDNERSLQLDQTDLINKFGIEVKDSIAYTPEQNGDSKRSRGVINERGRYIRIRARLLEEV